MVIPVSDVNPGRRTPWLTYALIAANIIVMFLTPAVTMVGVEDVSAADVCQLEAFYERYGAVPHELVNNEQLSRVSTGEVGSGPQGAACVEGQPAYQKLPPLSVLFSMFLHGGWLHLLGNMLFLWIFGNNVEDRFGRLGYLLFYLAAGYVAAYGFALANADSTQPLVGASGAVAGVLGAYLVLFPRATVVSLVPTQTQSVSQVRMPASVVLGMWFLLQWVYSAGYAVAEAGSVAYLAHVVGFVFGLLIAIPVRLLRPSPPTASQLSPPPRAAPTNR